MSNSTVVILSAFVGVSAVLFNAMCILAIVVYGESLNGWIYAAMILSPFVSYACGLLHQDFATRALEKI